MKRERNPVLQLLESRVLLSGSVNVVGTVVNIVGTMGADQIAVEAQSIDFPASVRVTINGRVTSLDPSKIDLYKYRVRGLSGDDHIIVERALGTLANSTIFGGAGNDTIQLNGTTVEGALVVAGGGDDAIGIHTAEAAPDPGLPGPSPTLLAGDGDDTIVAGDMDDLIRGGAGDDLIQCGAGRDTVFGDAGNDIIRGDAGADFLFGGDGDDHILGGTGADVIYGNRGRDTLVGGKGADLVRGGGGADVLL